LRSLVQQTRDGMIAATEDGDGDAVTDGASTDDLDASFCENTLIT